MNYTGVFATEDEFSDLLNLARRGWMDGDTVMVSSVMEGLRKDQSTINAKVACHKVALAHGLPEIEGYYGIDKNMQFILYER